MNEADQELRRQRADTVLYTHYRSRGLEYCHETSGIDRDYLRQRVRYLGLRVSAETMTRLRKDAAEKRKKSSPPTKPKPSKHRPPAPTPARAADVKLSKEERLALGLRS